MVPVKSQGETIICAHLKLIPTGTLPNLADPYRHVYLKHLTRVDYIQIGGS